MQIDLSITGYRIRMREEQDHASLAWPMSPFGAFLGRSSDRPDIDLSVAVVQVLPSLPHGPLLFDACHGLWRLYRADKGFLLESLDTHTRRARSYALIDSDYSRGEVWTLEEETAGMRGWTPMKIINPLVEICFLTKLARRGGLLLHSAGLLTDKGGYLFIGASGAGKSTMAEFFANEGASVLSDERTVIQRDGTGIAMYGTPWVGSGAYAKNEAGLLTALYCIRQGSQHRIQALSPSAALSLLLPQCFLPHWDRHAMESTLSFLGELFSRVPCRALAFAKQPDIVSFVEQQQAGLSLVAS